MADRGPVPRRPLVFLMVLAALLTLPRLGERPYWGDEREDFNFIYRILDHGVPDMTGGHTDGGPQVNEDHLHVYHPWLYLYQGALSVKLFGWDDRFAFRIWGVFWFLLSIPVIFRLARRLGQRGRFATGLYVLSPLALVPARASRYYGAVLCFGSLVVLDYLRTRDGSRWAPWRLGLWMSLLFHHNTMAAAALGLGLLAHWLISGRERFGAYCLSAGIAAGPIFWWLVPMGAIDVGGMLDPAVIPTRGIKTVWLLLATTLPAPLLWSLWRRRDMHRRTLRLLLCLLVPLVLLVSASTHVTPNPRYLLPWLPLGCIALGLWLEHLESLRARLLFVLLALSNVVQLVPLGLVNMVPAGTLAAYGRSAGDAERFMTATATPRFLLLNHVAELGGGYVAPGESLKRLFEKAGYVKGDPVRILIGSEDRVALNRHLLAEALFDLNEGRPGEMIEGLDADAASARFCVAMEEGVTPGPGFELVGTSDNRPGFWIEGPNPFNRRYSTLRGGHLRLWRRESP